MADGSLQTIDQLQVGDRVMTGMDGSTTTGRVTQTLHHPVHATIPVTRRRTPPYGELIGTPDHPVWNEETATWVEFADLVLTGDTAQQQQHDTTLWVDVLYNLEIDGDAPGSSSHSYVVNGIVASGLGDGEELNRMFARQKVWAEETAQY